MPSGNFMAVTRRAAVLACMLLAAVIALWTAPLNAATAAPPAVSGLRPASATAVLSALGVGDVRAQIVILIDISGSMASNDLYPAVRQDVPAFLRTLQTQDPEDLVGVILFGGPGDDIVTDPGPPNPGIWLPPVPYAQETDFGHAFQLAVQMFQGAQIAQDNIQLGSVLLLSDGEVSMPFDDDPTYGTGFGGPGWMKLRTEVQNLPIPVTGYDVPLTGNPVFIGNQHAALSQVFQPVETLPYGTTDLSQDLNLAKQDILDRKVATAAAHDSGQGVRVSWDGPPGDHGRPLDLAAGHADVFVTLTAATRHVPLYLSGLSVTSVGLPSTMRGTFPGGRTLLPGQRAIFDLRLTWAPKRNGMTMTGGPRAVHGRLELDATVSSSFTPTLRSDFADTTFSVGGLQGASSPLFAASEPVQWSVLEALLIGLGAMVLLVGAISFRARMTGRLVLTTVDQASGEIRLRGLPWLSRRTQKLIGEPGRITVHGSVRRREIKFRLRIPQRDPFDGSLLPGKSQMPGGITVVHKPGSWRARFPWSRAGAR